MKFKVKDVVVIIKRVSHAYDLEIGTASRVLKAVEYLGTETEPVYYLIDDLSYINYYLESQLELEHIYNSPLNQALR